MFKKTLEWRSQQRLSGGDKKKLRRSIKDRFTSLSVDNDDSVLDSIMPPKSDITVSKLPSRVQVYAVEGGFPIFFDIDGRGSDIFPTVFALWRVPDMLPSFVLKGGEVSRYIIGGADLMFPGIEIPPGGLPSFSAGETWSVKVPGNPAPIAVGSTAVSSDEALKAGLRGKALRITHYYRDLLWDAVEGKLVPNAGYFEDVVLADPASCQASNLCAEDASHDHDDDETRDEEAEGSVVNGTDDLPMTQVEAGNYDAADEIASGVADLVLPADNAAVEDQHPLTPEEMDLLLDRCLLQALHTTVKDLPMPGSTLWSNHILPCRPPGVTLDIKKSTHKKLSKWLLAKSYQQHLRGSIINVQEDKHKKEVVLISINRNHPDYASFKPEKRQQLEKTEETADHTAGGSRSNKTLEVDEMYKPSVHVNPIFAAVGSDKGELYSASDAAAVVFKYVDNENLVKPTDKSIVVLDALLCDALFKGTIKKGSTYPSEIHKKDLGSAFVSRMQPHHVVTRGNESVVRKGGLKPIQMMTERRQGNKKVTKLSGMEQFLIDAESLASELQKKFACSTSVAELPGKKGHEVLVQGGVIDNLAKYLIEQYGIPKRYIEVLDKTRK